MLKEFIEPYKLLINIFLNHEISAEVFEEEYNKLFRKYELSDPDKPYHILDKLFAEVDAYWSGCKPEDEANGRFDCITEQTLRKYAAEALDKLNALD